MASPNTPLPQTTPPTMASPRMEKPYAHTNAYARQHTRPAPSPQTLTARTSLPEKTGSWNPLLPTKPSISMSAARGKTPPYNRALQPGAPFRRSLLHRHGLRDELAVLALHLDARQVLDEGLVLEHLHGGRALHPAGLGHLRVHIDVDLYQVHLHRNGHVWKRLTLGSLDRLSPRCIRRALFLEREDHFFPGFVQIEGKYSRGSKASKN